MQIQVEEITPEVAESLLLLNFGNRPVNDRHINRLANSMASGNWKLNGESIKLTPDRLLDGQQRLRAVIKSGATIQTVVVRGLDSEVFHTLDGNRKRSPADILSIHGEKDCSALAASLKWVDAYWSGRLLAGNIKPSQDYTNAEHLALLEEHPTIRRSVALAHGIKRLMPISIGAAAHYLFSYSDTAIADKFFEQLRFGENLGKHDPVYLLRERLINNIQEKGKLSNRYIFALLIKAWNAHKDGATMRQLAWREGGPYPEAFPTIK